MKHLKGGKDIYKDILVKIKIYISICFYENSFYGHLNLHIWLPDRLNT